MPAGKLDALLDRFLNGSLDEVEAGELSAELRADLQARRRFVELIDQEATLHVLARARQESLNASRPPGVRAVGDASRRYGIVLGRMRGRTVRVIAAATLAALVLLTVSVGWRPTPPDGRSARISALSGVVTVLRGEERTVAVSGLALLPGDIVETGAASGATLAYQGEQTHLTLGAAARIRLSSEGGAKQLELPRGAIQGVVAAQPQDRPLVVTTPHARAELDAVRFALRVSAAGGSRAASAPRSSAPSATRLEVTEGLARLVRLTDALPIELAKGQYAVAAEGAVFVPQAISASVAAGEAGASGDLNGDGVVNSSDLTPVTSHFGQQSGDPGWDARADANGDGVVNSSDLAVIMHNFGKTSP